MEHVLIKDRDWSAVEGEICRVIDFTPLAKVKSIQFDDLAKVEGGDVISVASMPYASLELECFKLTANTSGYIAHKLDFIHLWIVFNERGISSDEEVLITWTKKPLRGIYKLLSAFMPRLWVAIFKKGAYDLLVEQKRGGDPTFFAEMPIEIWQPKIWGYS